MMTQNEVIPNEGQMVRMFKSLHKAQFVYIENGVLWYRIFWLDKHPDGIQFLNDFQFPVTQEWIGKNVRVYTNENVEFFRTPIEAYVKKLRAEQEKNG